MYLYIYIHLYISIYIYIYILKKRTRVGQCMRSFQKIAMFCDLLRSFAKECCILCVLLHSYNTKERCVQNVKERGAQPLTFTDICVLL